MQSHRDASHAGETRFRDLIKKNADGMVVLRPDGSICYMNPAAEALVGREAGRLFGEAFAIPIKRGETTEIDIVRKGEAERVAEARVVETEWEGQPALLATLRDVTPYKRAEKTLRFLTDASSALADLLDPAATVASVGRLAVSHLADWCAIDMRDADGFVERVALSHADPAREAAAQGLCRRYRLTGNGEYGVAKVLQTGHSEIFLSMRPACWEAIALDADVLASVRTLGGRTAMVAPLAAHGHILGAMTLVAGESRRHYGPSDLTLGEDLARRAALALDRARLYQEAQDAVKRRDEFLAMLAHELRNPLAPILQAAHLIGLRGGDDPSLQRAREVLERQGRHMARLLDDLLDIARVTSGKIQLRKEPVALASILADAVQASQTFMTRYGHALIVSVPEEPLPLLADPTRLEQVFVNLLNNAAKYTRPGGRIWLTAGREGQTVKISVRDAGQGIAADMLPRVFDLFAQADRSLHRSLGGLGIGLTMVRKLVELHGGTVTASSPGVDQGSEFVVRLPVSDDAGAVLPAATVHLEPAVRKVLLVEDNADGRAMLKELLELWGYRVREAEDGPASLAQAEAFRPEVALIDIGLPGLSGYDVVRQLRRRPGGDKLVLIALSGYGQPDDCRLALEAGFDAHMVKPVNLTELARLLTAAVQGRAALASFKRGQVGSE